MSQKISVLAKVYPKKEFFKEIKNLIQDNVGKANREIGNLEYSLFVSKNIEHELLVIEKWETEADYMRHKKSEYLINFNKLTENKLKKETEVEIYNCIKG